MDRARFLKYTRYALLGFAFALALVACLVSFLALDSFYLQHERAAARWKLREPHHYSYTITIDGANFVISYQIEILDNKIVQTIDTASGEPARMWALVPASYLQGTGMIRNYMIIDKIFNFIEASRKPPKTTHAFFSRLYPEFYSSLVNQGILSDKKITCDPAFPRVRYNPEFGFPEELELGGNPCTFIIEQQSPIFIWIDDFQVLP